MKKQKQYPESKKAFIERKKSTHKDFKISLVSIEVIENFKTLAKSEGLSDRELFEKTFK